MEKIQVSTGKFQDSSEVDKSKSRKVNLNLETSLLNLEPSGAAGGIVLCNIAFLDEEINPVNRGKKDAILKTLLVNLGARVSQDARPTPGWRLAYKPLPIPLDRFNLNSTRDRQPAWFDGPAGDLAHLPSGESVFADVRFATVDLRTSPAENVISLAGHSGRVQATTIAPIPVNLTADVLYFLHAWQPHNDLWHRHDNNPNDPRPWVMFTYRATYADGEVLDIPVAWQRDIGPWQTPTPATYPNAALGWTGPAPAGQTLRPVLYVMQWDNPRPTVAITTLEPLRHADGRWGAPAILAITAATIEK